MLDLTKLYLFIFGVLTIAGGVWGYVKARKRGFDRRGRHPAGSCWRPRGHFVGTGKVQLGLILGLVVSLALAGQFVGQVSEDAQIYAGGD